ncbi:MAG: LiaI-LiaF-like domain-containing protein [Syntrophomonadaceae bacterium]
MRTNHLFWGILFITLGVLVLMNNFMVLNFNWDMMWNLWPLVLVLIGVYFIFREANFRWIIVLVIAFLLGIVIFAGVKSFSLFFDGEYDDFNVSVQEFTLPYENSIKKAKLNLEAAAGNFRLDGTTDSLIYAKTKGGFSDYSLNNETTDGSADISFEMGDKHPRVIHGLGKNRVELRLNSNPVWDMDLNVGAATVNLDLEPFKTENIYLKSGASSLKLRLGDKNPMTKVKFESGVSRLEIMVPKASGCEINSDTHFSRKEFSEFEKVDDNVYRTRDFASSGNKIYLDIAAGVSSVKVERY